MGKPCIGGYDSAVKHDLVAFLATFTDKDGVVEFSAASGHRLDGSQGRRPGERELFEQWLRAGWLIGVPGDIIDPDGCCASFHFSTRGFRSRKSATTSIHGRDQARDVEGRHCPSVVEFRQGYISMGPALSTSGTSCAPAKFAMAATRS